MIIASVGNPNPLQFIVPRRDGCLYTPVADRAARALAAHGRQCSATAFRRGRRREEPRRRG
jgi:hypothetical protein